VDTIQFAGSVELTATGEGKPARISILAYGGGIMDVPGFGPVLVDLAGLQMAATIPLLADHNSTLEGVAGSGAPRVVNGTLRVEGTIANSPAGAAIRELAASGVPLQASIGVEPSNRARVDAGAKVVANGREHVAGPRGLTHIRAGVLREVSVLPLGADAGTTVSIAARKGTTVDTATITAPDVVQAERERVSEIFALCGGQYADVQAQAIAAGWDVPTLKAALYDAAKRQEGVERIRARGNVAPGAFIPRGDGLDTFGRPRDILAASMLVTAGREDVAVKSFGERVCASLERCTGWPELCAQALRLEGRTVPHGRNELIKAGFSTVNMPVSLGLSVEKVVLSVFLENSENWRPLARIVNAQTFRDGKAIRLSAASKLLKVGGEGELKSGNLAEDAFTYRVDTYGRLFTLSRQEIINDDMGVLNDLPIVLGNESARTVSDLFFSTLTGNAGSFFGTANGNQISGGTVHLDLNALSMAIAKLRTRTDRDGRIIGFQPVTLVVPAARESDARQLLNSVQLYRDQTTDQQPSGNPLAGLNLGLVVEARLDATSATDWYLFSQPGNGTFLVAFLQGRESPIVEVAPEEADTLGLSWRAYFDFGVAQGDSRAAVMADATP
jgi:hypothetical protein